MPAGMTLPHGRASNTVLAGQRSWLVVPPLWRKKARSTEPVRLKGGTTNTLHEIAG